jgi:hypothetical protein
MRLHIGASRLRKTLKSLDPEDALPLMTRLFPELSHRRIQTLIANLDETTVSGPHLTMPKSWDALLGEGPTP